jgi:hypothetical protein
MNHLELAIADLEAQRAEIETALTALRRLVGTTGAVRETTRPAAATTGRVREPTPATRETVTSRPTRASGSDAKRDEILSALKAGPIGGTAPRVLAEKTGLAMSALRYQIGKLGIRVKAIGSTNNRRYQLA